MASLHARTEPHSRYAIFFIQSGGQVKNIVLNIILYTTQPQRILSFATRECARGSIVRRITGRGLLVITMEFEQRDRNYTETEETPVLATYAKCSRLRNRNCFTSNSSPAGYRSQRVAKRRRETIAIFPNTSRGIYL